MRLLAFKTKIVRPSAQSIVLSKSGRRLRFRPSGPKPSVKSFDEWVARVLIGISTTTLNTAFVLQSRPYSYHKFLSPPPPSPLMPHPGPITAFAALPPTHQPITSDTAIFHELVYEVPSCVVA
nr:expressed protein [Hymenolepis microstoma]